PKLHPLVRLQEVLEMKNSDTKLIAWINDEVKSFIPNNYRAGQDVSILIGPEGGFTGEEAQLAINAGYRAVSLGGNRLRTETAAITAAQCVAQLNWSY
ncbi:MAG: RsmE family RNA methyltransferase, partial [Bacteroidota bacterium]